jgi:hypothetical protein
MDFVVGIFFFGLAVTLLVGKGLLMANDYVAAEREVSQNPGTRNAITD